MPLITYKVNFVVLKYPLKLSNAGVIVRCIINSDPPKLKNISKVL